MRKKVIFVGLVGLLLLVGGLFKTPMVFASTQISKGEMTLIFGGACNSCLYNTGNCRSKTCAQGQACNYCESINHHQGCMTKTGAYNCVQNDPIPNGCGPWRINGNCPTGLLCTGGTWDEETTCEQGSATGTLCI